MARIVTSYDNVNYKARRSMLAPSARNNGQWHYSHTIIDKIAPLIKTNRGIDGLGIRCCKTENHAIVFIHSNVKLKETYGWMKRYRDLILVCNNYNTVKEMNELFPYHKAIFLPLSVDKEEVLTHKHRKKFDSCYAGNLWGFKKDDIAKYVPEGTTFFTKMEREELLDAISEYKNVYAVGLTAVEAKVLGCKIKVCDHRFPDPDFWQPLDYKDAAVMLQKEIDKIDKGEK